jgi:hypothetical protein
VKITKHGKKKNTRTKLEIFCLRTFLPIYEFSKSYEDVWIHLWSRKPNFYLNPFIPLVQELKMGSILSLLKGINCTWY